MSTLTKNQHYVWRHYLKDWTGPSDNIFCLFRDQKKVINTPTTNIAAERFFYKLEELSPADVQWITSIIERASIAGARQYHRETLQIFQHVFRLRRELPTMGLPQAAKQELVRELEFAEKTLGERWHSVVEASAKEILGQLKNGEIRFYLDQTERHKFIHFVSQQFFRTPKLRSLPFRSQHPFVDQDLDLRRTWFIESQIYALNIGTAIVAESGLYKFRFIRNKTDVSFVTSDQPIINLSADEDGLHLFYPLRPDLAVVFEKSASLQLAHDAVGSKLEIEYLNNRIVERSFNQVYGCDRAYLEALASMPKLIDER